MDAMGQQDILMAPVEVGGSWRKCRIKGRNVGKAPDQDQ